MTGTQFYSSDGPGPGKRNQINAQNTHKVVGRRTGSPRSCRAPVRLTPATRRLRAVATHLSRFLGTALGPEPPNQGRPHPTPGTPARVSAQPWTRTHPSPSSSQHPPACAGFARRFRAPVSTRRAPRPHPIRCEAPQPANFSYNRRPRCHFGFSFHLSTASCLLLPPSVPVAKPLRPGVMAMATAAATSSSLLTPAAGTAASAHNAVLFPSSLPSLRAYPRLLLAFRRGRRRRPAGGRARGGGGGGRGPGRPVRRRRVRGRPRPRVHAPNQAAHRQGCPPAQGRPRMCNRAPSSVWLHFA
jgi:hypothetical protein